MPLTNIRCFLPLYHLYRALPLVGHTNIKFELVPGAPPKVGMGHAQIQVGYRPHPPVAPDL